MNCAFRALTLVGLMTLPACISEGTRPLGDTGDSDGPADSGDDGTVAPDIAPDAVLPDGGEPDGTTPETSDDGVISNDGSGGACESDADCGEPSAVCHGWVCQAGTCVDMPLSGDSCEDENRCTEGDFCDGGVCAGGVSVDCTGLSPDCWFSQGDTCDPSIGCPGIASFPGDSCDDGIGLEGGLCHNGWLIPTDQCDGSGHCLDTSFIVPSSIHPLAGAWYTVISSAPNHAHHETLRGQLTFGQTGTLTASFVESTDSAWRESFGGADGAVQGSFCADLGGLVTLARGEHFYHGFADPSRSLFVFGSDDESALGVAVRPGGHPLDMTGIYRLVTTARYEFNDNALMTWEGAVEFDGGCLTSGSFFTTEGLGPSYELRGAGSGCLTSDHGLYRMDLELSDGLNEPFEISWLGAVGPDADVVLLTRDDIALRYGTIILVRQREIVPRAAMTGVWTFVSQRGGISDGNQFESTTVYESGWFQLGDDFRSIGGTVFRDGSQGAITGQWWFASDGGRYNQRAAFGDDVVHHTGYIAPNPDFMVDWVAMAPIGAVTEPQVLRLEPSEGSLLVAVRLLPYEDLAFATRFARPRHR